MKVESLSSLLHKRKLPTFNSCSFFKGPTQFVQILNSSVVTSSSVKIEWSFPEDDPQHPGFIVGYIVTFQNGHMIDQNPSESAKKKKKRKENRMFAEMNTKKRKAIPSIAYSML